MKKLRITALTLMMIVSLSLTAFAGTLLAPAKGAKYSAGSTITIKAQPDESQCTQTDSYCLVHIYSVTQKGVQVYEKQIPYTSTDIIEDKVTIKNKGDYTIYITFGYLVNGFKNNYSGTGRYICGNRTDIYAHKAVSISVGSSSKASSPKTSISSLKAVKKGFNVTWKKKTCNGYQLRYSVNSSMSDSKKVTVKGSKMTSKKVTKLTAKQKYYVQIRTYKTVNGKKVYSAWSAKKSVTTK